MKSRLWLDNIETPNRPPEAHARWTHSEVQPRKYCLGQSAKSKIPYHLIKLLVNLPVKITNTCEIIDVWHNWLALYRGTINSKLTIWSFDTWVDGDVRVWHYNEVFYMERKRDLIISWQYASLAMIQGAIKWGFTVFVASPLSTQH